MLIEITMIPLSHRKSCDGKSALILPLTNVLRPALSGTDNTEDAYAGQQEFSTRYHACE